MGFFLSKKFWLPLLALFAAEGFFASGLYEPIAEPASFAGRTSRLKEALLTLDESAPYSMTLGNSLALLGLDHRLLHDNAAKSGKTHYRMALAGTHVAMLHMQSQWLAEHLPRVEGLVIGVGIRGFYAPTLGYYELPAVTPFRSVKQIPWLTDLFGIEVGEGRSYGTVSAMMNYREDVAALLRDPKKRRKALLWEGKQDEDDVLLFQARSDTNICPIDTSSPEACLTSIAAMGEVKRVPGGLRTQEVRRACERATRFRLPPMKTEDVEKMRQVWSNLLAPLSRRHRIAFVLMPAHPLTRNNQLSENLHETALLILRGLENEGVLSLLDLTTLFDDAAHPPCHYFQDLQHAGAAGRARITSEVIDHLNQIGFYR